MGLGGISIWQLLIVLAIVILLFGTKRLRNFGSDLGNAVKGFRKAMDTNDQDTSDQDKADPAQLEEQDNDIIEGKAEKTKQKDSKK